MGRKKKHITFYDDGIWKKLNEIKKSEDITYDELLRKYLKLPESDDLIRFRYEDVRDMLMNKYKNEDLQVLMGLLWVFIIKAAKEEYDIKRLVYDIENDIRLKTYKKR